MNPHSLTKTSFISNTTKVSRSHYDSICLPVQQRRGVLNLSRIEGGRSSVSGVIATVFGCTGFLGRYVVNSLGRVGSQVVIPYRGEEKSYTHLKVMGDLGQIIPLQWDIRDKDSIRHACRYSNVIINLVGSKYDTRNFTLHNVHVEGAKRIAEVAKELDVDKFIHVSALGASLDASSDWLKTKAEGELAVKSIFPKATIVRPGTMFGAQDNYLNSIATMMKFWPAYLLLNANTEVQPLWVNDVAKAILNMLKIRESEGITYELGGPHIVTNRQLVEWVNSLLKYEKRIIEVDNENIAWHLGYWWGQHRNPRFTLDTIKQTENIVCSKNYPGFSELDIKPVSLTSPTGRGVILYLRKPSRMLDITLDSQEMPEELEAGKPAY